MTHLRLVDEPLLNKAQLAEKLQISYRTIERWNGLGMPGIGKRQSRRYRLSDVEAWMCGDYERPA